MGAKLRGRGTSLGATGAQNFRSQTSGRLQVRAQICDDGWVVIGGFQRQSVSTAPAAMGKRRAPATSNGARLRKRATSKVRCFPPPSVRIGTVLRLHGFLIFEVSSARGRRVDFCPYAMVARTFSALRCCFSCASATLIGT